MAQRKRTVEIEILADDKRARAGLRTIGDEATKTGKKFSDAAKVIGAAIAVKATQAVGDFVGDSVRAFSDLNESTNAVNVTFGQSADAIQKIGKTSATSFGLAESEFNSFAVSFSAFVDKIAGNTGRDVASVMEDLMTRVADFASVMNLDVSEAAEKFRSGLAGETEPLRQFGLDVSAAAVNAKAMELNLGDAHGVLSEGEKIVARYQLIMEQTEKTAGDFANTSDQLANKQRITAAEIENTKAAIGEGFAAVVESALPLTKDFAETVGVLAFEFLNIVGVVNDTNAAIKQFELLTGESAETGQGLLTILKLEKDELDELTEKTKDHTGATTDFDSKAKDLIDTLTLSQGEYQKMIEALRNGQLDWAFTSEEVETLVNLLEKRFKAAAHAARVSMKDDIEQSALDAREALDEAAEATSNLTSELLELADPAYRAAAANEAARDAADTYRQAVADFGPDSVQARSALADWVLKSGEAKAAQDLLGENQGTLDALLEIAEQLGLTTEQVQILKGWYDRLALTDLWTPAQREQAREAKEAIEDINAGGGRRSSGATTNLPVFHSGGVVPGPAGANVPIMAQAGETVLPRGASGGGVTVVVQGFVGSEAQLAQELDRILSNRKRRSGLGFQ